VHVSRGGGGGGGGWGGIVRACVCACVFVRVTYKHILHFELLPPCPLTTSMSAQSILLPCPLSAPEVVYIDIYIYIHIHMYICVYFYLGSSIY